MQLFDLLNQKPQAAPRVVR